jgi:hypothetical protein
VFARWDGCQAVLAYDFLKCTRIDLGYLSSLSCENILIFRNANHLYNTPRLVPLEEGIFVLPSTPVHSHGVTKSLNNRDFSGKLYIR